MSIEDRDCVICGTPFSTYISKNKTCCSLSCSTKLRHQNQGHKSPEVRECLVCGKSFTTRGSGNQVCCSNSCGAKKRFQNPIARKQVSENTKKQWQNPKYKRTGGFGIITKPQRILFQELGPRWETEVAIGLGKQIPGWPNYYKVDIGNRRLKLAIEVDGKSHKEPKIQALDRKKEAKLKELGWRILRFWNWETLEDLPRVMKIIKDVIEDE